MANLKTNAMRILDKAGISYKTYTYDGEDDLIDGVSVAKKIGKPIECVYKTLVTRGASKEYYIFAIPVSGELDLKAAARVVNEKSVEMIKAEEINKVTGYVRGGCSPIGMKKDYPTVVDESCLVLDGRIVSAGTVGYPGGLAPDGGVNLIHGRIESIAL